MAGPEPDSAQQGYRQQHHRRNSYLRRSDRRAAHAWAPEALYFAANITDDVLVGNNSPQIWGDDVIELAIHIPQTNQTHQFTLRWTAASPTTATRSPP